MTEINRIKGLGGEGSVEPVQPLKKINGSAENQSGQDFVQPNKPENLEDLRNQLAELQRQLADNPTDQQIIGLIAYIENQMQGYK